VPQDTVLTIAVDYKPDSMPKLSEFKYDLSKFEKTSDPHVSGIIHYQSDEEGISFSVEGEFISNIAYYPAKKNWNLMCKPRQ
jgi:hypothetical protein